MGDIKFKCPSCAQPLEAPQDMVGQRTDCPTCRATINIPHSQEKTGETNRAIPASPSTPSSTKEAESTKRKKEVLGSGIGIGGLIVFAIGREIAKQFSDSLILKVVSAAFWGAAAGALVGLLPYFIGKRKGQKRVAIFALISSSVAGAILGLWLSIPVAAVFSTVILLITGPRRSDIENPSPRGSPNKASDATSEPAPGVASSAHQG